MLRVGVRGISVLRILHVFFDRQCSLVDVPLVIIVPSTPFSLPCQTDVSVTVRVEFERVRDLRGIPLAGLTHAAQTQQARGVQPHRRSGTCGLVDP